ncbi:MAG: hypothetical protein ACR2K4_10560 [Candidatus Limnocylindria bacterium]
MADDGESLSYSYGDPSRRLEFAEDKRACDIVVPPPPIVPLTEAEIRGMYAYWVEMRQRLADLGYVTSAPPSVEEFVRTWKASGPWSPYLDVPGRALERIEQDCPQSPPGL